MLMITQEKYFLWINNGGVNYGISEPYRIKKKRAKVC